MSVLEYLLPSSTFLPPLVVWNRSIFIGVGGIMVWYKEVTPGRLGGEGDIAKKGITPVNVSGGPPVDVDPSC